MIYTAFSLVDITQTDVNRNNNLQFNQQQNLNTLIQSIGLRSQPINTKVKVFMAQDVVDYEFGKRYQGLHTVWQFNFSIEHTDVFNYNNTDLYHLYKDADGVAIYTGLEESNEITTGCFETIDSTLVNLYFKTYTD